MNQIPTLQWVAVVALKLKKIDHVTQKNVANSGSPHTIFAMVGNGMWNKFLLFSFPSWAIFWNAAIIDVDDRILSVLLYIYRMKIVMTVPG